MGELHTIITQISKSGESEDIVSLCTLSEVSFLEVIFYSQKPFYDSLSEHDYYRTCLYIQIFTAIVQERGSQFSSEFVRIRFGLSQCLTCEDPV